MLKWCRRAWTMPSSRPVASAGARRALGLSGAARAAFCRSHPTAQGRRRWLSKPGASRHREPEAAHRRRRKRQPKATTKCGECTRWSTNWACAIACRVRAAAAAPRACRPTTVPPMPCSCPVDRSRSVSLRSRRPRAARRWSRRRSVGCSPLSTMERTGYLIDSRGTGKVHRGDRSHPRRSDASRQALSANAVERASQLHMGHGRGAAAAHLRRPRCAARCAASLMRLMDHPLASDDELQGAESLIAGVARAPAPWTTRRSSR